MSEVAAAEIIQADSTEAPELQVSAEAQASEAPEKESEESPESGAPEEGADNEAFDFESLPEYQEAMKEAGAEEQQQAEARLPGISIEEAEARVDRQRAQEYAQIMQATDGDWRGFFQNSLGMSPQESQAAWQKISPVLRALHQNNLAHNAAFFDYAVTQVLPREQADIYGKKGYNNQIEALAAVYELGKMAGSKELEGKVAKNYVPKKSIKKILEAAAAQETAKRQEADGLSQSGQRLNGGTGSNGFKSLAALNAAKTAGRIDNETYLKEQNKLLGIS